MEPVAEEKYFLTLFILGLNNNCIFVAVSFKWRNQLLIG